MSRLSNFMTEKSMNVAKLRNADGYENMSRQYLENIFTMPSVSIPKAISIFTSEPRELDLQSNVHPFPYQDLVSRLNLFHLIWII